jgi:signal transduction histidine kinase
METHSVPLRGPGGAVVAALGITRDVTARRRAERLLRERERELRSLTAHLQQVREEERKRMAREIHDVLGQTLTALRLDLDWLSQSLRPGEQTLTRKIADMSALVVSTIRSVRRIATELRPVVLDDLGLAAAIQWQAREFSERTGVDCRLRAPPDDDGLDPDAAATLFRIFQEALTNIARHARATLVETALRRDGEHLVLEVWDNGRGITDAERENPDSLGVVSMRERAMLLGGSLEITGFAGRGTRLRVAVPAAARAPA